MTLEDKTTGCITGAAVGDALGGATEGYSTEQILERWGDWVTGVVPPYHEDWRNARPMSPLHKGDGHITDDTLMTRLLAEVYCEKRAHLDAFDMAERLVPRMIDVRTWIPELEAEAVPIQRLFLAEKYLAFRLNWAHIDPREAGVGNAVNCGAAMYIAPVGIVNACDPERAYAEAIEITGAHQHSYGREAAGVMAAAVAAAMAPGAGVEDVIEAALIVAHDGTYEAISAVVDAARGYDDWRSAIQSGGLRDAMRPFDTVADTYRQPGLGARRPSRLHSIEELPLALAFLVIAEGDWASSVYGGVNYGRDSDSIASMAGAIAGALGGTAAVPAELVQAVSTASKVDIAAFTQPLAEVARAIRQDDAAAAARTTALFDALSGHEVP